MFRVNFVSRSSFGIPHRHFGEASPNAPALRGPGSGQLRAPPQLRLPLTSSSAAAAHERDRASFAPQPPETLGPRNFQLGNPRRPHSRLLALATVIQAPTESAREVERERDEEHQPPASAGTAAPQQHRSARLFRGAQLHSFHHRSTAVQPRMFSAPPLASLAADVRR